MNLNRCGGWKERQPLVCTQHGIISLSRATGLRSSTFLRHSASVSGVGFVFILFALLMTCGNVLLKQKPSAEAVWSFLLGLWYSGRKPLGSLKFILKCGWLFPSCFFIICLQEGSQRLSSWGFLTLLSNQSSGLILPALVWFCRLRPYEHSGLWSYHFSNQGFEWNRYLSKCNGISHHLTKGHYVHIKCLLMYF